ncbi:hypothetical protein [Alicyclobacillus acidoterrestris]|uniref:Uncharacterized protein n=1 Tax=Alicyclobacillus acidoterrestris (strain ATCC 49025 / DSM 3922 / CIP 106132 / NCIMB 13137 / GD3B) TaxID=1356854 RepID=T0BZI3_ALIAG|nr:hypothetical protein [Alicyclobacillus acidoterrestris]EPZ46204.1 hypothetical protein N007_06835 [Alicyclobacillus acidoterrestris ATCC 49025]UNO47161.1 hypothetical protein K1I37_10385 [Alicyclobacillus acidoterrestris]
MTRLNRTKCTAGAVAVALTGLVSGCGAPDLSAMRPTVQKQAAAVMVVGKPDFMPTTPVSASGDEPLMMETVQSSTGSFLNQANTLLQHQDVTNCVIAVDDAGALDSDISQLAQKYAHVHFDILTNQAPSDISASNVAIVSQDANAVDFAIGWLVGVWASNLVKTQQLSLQPAVGYAVSGVSASRQKAFFAGLYTANPAAQIVNMTGSNNSASNNTSNSSAGNSTTTTSTAPTQYPVVSGVVVGGNLAQPVAESIAQNAPIVFDLTGASTTLPNLSVYPGHLAPSRATDLIDQISGGHWQAGSTSVIDSTSVTLNTQLMPPPVVDAWQTLAQTLEQAPNTWQTDYAKLPDATRNLLQSQFGLA